MAGARVLLSSPRRRRRLTWLAALLLVGGVIAYLVAYQRNTAPSTATPLSNKPSYVPPANPTSVPFGLRKRHEVLGVARKFLLSVVDRSNPDAAWTISSAKLRAGYTRKQWASGNNPIVPFPVGRTRWKLDASYRNAVFLEVAVWPKGRSRLNPMVFYLDEVRATTRHGSTWLVDDWQPAPGAAQVQVAGSGKPGSPTAPPPAQSALNAKWLIAPIGVFLLILLVPLTIGMREWRRGRRALRDYRATLPSLDRYRSS
jgi:hypothetical protein